MQSFFNLRVVLGTFLLAGMVFFSACDQPTTNNTVSVNTKSANTNSAVNMNSTSNSATSTASTVSIESKEPEQYQAKISLKLEATGASTTALPPIVANVARNGAERRMEFTLTDGEKIIYLDKPDNKYLLLPKRKQYAVLDKESLGFEIRQMMLPSQIIDRVKAAPGVEKVGEEDFAGRKAVKYRYGTVTNTQSQAGKVDTQSFFYVDKETSLPLHSETVSTSQNGNVQGFSGLKIITDLSDISTTVAPDQFALPTDFQKIESDQVKAQVSLIFNTVSVLLNQMMKSAAPAANANTNANSAAPANK